MARYATPWGTLSGGCRALRRRCPCRCPATRQRPISLAWVCPTTSGTLAWLEPTVIPTVLPQAGVLPAAVIEPGETRNPITSEGQTNQLPVPNGGEDLRRTAWAETTAAAQ